MLLAADAGHPFRPAQRRRRFPTVPGHTGVRRASSGRSTPPPANCEREDQPLYCAAHRRRPPDGRSMRSLRQPGTLIRKRADARSRFRTTRRSLRRGRRHRSRHLEGRRCACSTRPLPRPTKREGIGWYEVLGARKPSSAPRTGCPTKPSAKFASAGPGSRARSRHRSVAASAA